MNQTHLYIVILKACKNKKNVFYLGSGGIHFDSSSALFIHSACIHSKLIPTISNIKSVHLSACTCMCLFSLPHGKISRCPLNQNVYPVISNTGSSKPEQWLTDPYSNSCSTPANKINFFFPLLKVHADQKLTKKRGRAERDML